MTTLVCLLEEPSAKAMLEELFKRLLPDDIDRILIAFEGKQDLEKQMERRIRKWMRPNSVFLVMRDQDAGDCITIKQNLLSKIQRTGKAESTLIRIACHELESFYIGDLKAVEQGLQLHGIAKHRAKAKYRSPDNLGNPAEELKKLTKGAYQKLSGSRAIAPYMDFEGNASHSFCVLIDGIKKLVGIERKI